MVNHCIRARESKPSLFHSHPNFPHPVPLPWAMDGVSDEWPWLPAILVIDFGDRLSHGDTLSLSLVCLILSSYLFFGSWLDAILVSLTVGLKAAASLASWIQHSASGQVSLASASALLAAWLTFNHARSSYTSGDQAPWNGPAKPYLIPCRTTHSRKDPKKHSFSYSYLVMGTPVGYSGNVNGIASVDVQRQSKQRAWFDVDAADCLRRGHGEVGLRGKLDDYLKSQVCHPAPTRDVRLMGLGRRPPGLPIRLPHHGPQISWISLQPSLLLVPLLL